MSQPNSSGMPPAVAAGADRTAGEDVTDRSTDDGVPVGAADAEADAHRAGADDDDAFAGEASGAALLSDNGATDAGVPVGSADADADQGR